MVLHKRDCRNDSTTIIGMSSSKLLSSLFGAAEGVLLALLVKTPLTYRCHAIHRLLFVRQHLPYDVIRTNADIVDKPQL